MGICYMFDELICVVGIISYFMTSEDKVRYEFERLLLLLFNIDRRKIQETRPVSDTTPDLPTLRLK